MERFNFYAEVSDVLAENPEVVIVAAGGLPNTEFLRDGADLVIPSRISWPEQLKWKRTFCSLMTTVSIPEFHVRNF